MPRKPKKGKQECSFLVYGIYAQILQYSGIAWRGLV